MVLEVAYGLPKELAEGKCSQASFFEFETAKMRRQDRTLSLALAACSLIAFSIVTGCNSIGGHKLQQISLSSPTTTDSASRLTFVQWTDPHLFDSGSGRHGEGIEEEALDNRAALHWAVLETNRLALLENRPINFVVITGDFGLENIRLPDIKGLASKKCECPRHE